ncbi:fimbrillin family protein [Dysgonomonas sp. ZJ709]|uniref:fimbrillin family protein n=1 Tax=Dysgonomonas sp. ZJ709 TaxID=2709797 RepID=UPI0013EC5AD0|nr:fimbrillin family protein [Dysgonomonas sp. ZJ709]
MKKLSTLLTAVLFFVSCSNDDETSVSGQKEIRFSTEVVSTKSGYESALIAKDQQIGVLIAENSATPATIYEQNLAYTADGAGSLAGITQYFPTNGNSLKISAYHPYSATENATYAFTVLADQTDAPSIHASDLLHCAEFVQSATTAQIVLNFKHKLSQITYTLSAGNGSPDLAGAKVSVVNAFSAIEFNRLTGVLGSTSKMQEVQLGEGVGIIVPQEVAAGTKFLKITLASGKQLYYTTPSNITLVSGKKYNFDLQINLSDASSIGTSVEEWETGGTITGGAEEEISEKLLPAQINYEFPEATCKYVFTYGDLNRLSVLEMYNKPYPTSKPNMIEYSHITFEYDDEGNVIGYRGNLPNENNPASSATSNATFIYNDVAKQVTLKEDFTMYGSTKTNTYIFDVDEEGRFLSGDKSNYTVVPEHEYDEKGNLVKRTENYSDNSGNVFKNVTVYQYDSKNSILKNLNIPAWLINYFSNQINSKSLNNVNDRSIAIYKNGNLLPEDDTVYAWAYTYNAQDYPTALVYTLTDKITNKVWTYTTTVTYKAWKK